MKVKAMHYDFKQKMNKADSQQYRDFRVPEIDWWLNEAQLFLLKTTVNPKTSKMLEMSPRSIDDVNTILVRRSVAPVPQSSMGMNRYVVDMDSLLPDFLYYVSGEAVISCDECGSRIARLIERRHNDMHEYDEFNRSSYEWGQVNFVMECNDDKYDMVLFTDGDYVTAGSFSIDEVLVDYLKNPQMIYYGGYTVLDGVTPQTSQDCELPEHIHTDIVDIAVMLASGAIQSPDIQQKMNKIQLINN